MKIGSCRLTTQSRKIEACGVDYNEQRPHNALGLGYPKRYVFEDVPRSKSRKAAAMLKAIHTQKDREAAMTKANTIGKKLIAMRLPAVAKCFTSGVNETLGYM